MPRRDDDDAPRPPRHVSKAYSGHGGSAFLTMFGGSLGCAAGCGCLLLAGIIGLAFLIGVGSSVGTTAR